MDRRIFLQGTIASLAVSPTLRASSKSYDVIVVGAGLAGLNAALTLQMAGMKVLVLEATSQSGGRIHTMELPIGRVNVGGTTIGPYYARIRTLVDELNVELEGPGPRTSMANFVNGQLVAGEDWSTSPANLTVGPERDLQPAQLEFGLVGPQIPLRELDDWLDPQLIKTLDVPYQNFLQEKGVSEEAIRLINVTTNVTDVRNVSALGQLRDLHRLAWGLSQTDSSRRGVYDPPEGRAHQVKGGTQRLAEAMEAALEEPIHFETPVVAVNQTDTAVTVTALGGKQFTASFAVVAAPPPALRNIRFTPGLSGKLFDAVTSSIHSSTAHYFFAVKSPFWEKDVGAPALFSDTLVERVFAIADSSSKEVTYLDCWVNGVTAQQLDQLPANESAQLVTDHLAKIRPSTKGNIEFVGHYSWGRHPYILGHRHEYTAGQIQRFGNAFNEPWQRVRFAGEHCRVLEAGMEAAATAGERAALSIINEAA